MVCHESWWWIFPLMCLGMMILFSFGFARRGWCRGSRRRRGDEERVRKLEDELQGLKDQLTEERLMK